MATSLRRARRILALRRKTFFSIAGTGVVIFCVAAWPFTKAHLQAISVLRQVADQPVPQIAKGLNVAVSRQDLTFAVNTAADGQQQVRARLYLPQNQPHAPAMVIFHGVHHLGIDEPRLVGFAAAMASCGLRVLTPELPDIKDYHVSQDSVRTIGESVQWFAERTGGPVAVMGLSFSGGLALVAAQNPQFAPAFKFVFAVGSQDSMARVTQYYLSSQDTLPDGSVEILKPHEYGPLVVEYEYLQDFVTGSDLGPVRSVLRAHLYEDKVAEEKALLGLSEAEKVEALALMDTSLPATRAKIATALLQHQGEFKALSPDGRLGTLKVPVYLLCGKDDNIIPSAETLWMESELPHRTLKAALVSPLLSHIDLDEPAPGWMDQWRLIHFFALMMHAAGS